MTLARVLIQETWIQIAAASPGFFSCQDQDWNPSMQLQGEAAVGLKKQAYLLRVGSC